MHSLTSVPANCPAWCQADHDEYGPSHYNEAPPVEAHELVSDTHTVFCIDLTQPQDGKHQISITGPMCDVAFPADDARRLALAILARLDVADR
ncbi:hypothetical protein ABZW11_04865 [Nonomuraea sp. NPDC004580]|uniref:hypothetical protein n=1 Tax=Nonomuraea sp. NPDC004580 TaxID=3154552 RepID=UPI0033BE17E5